MLVRSGRLRPRTTTTRDFVQALVQTPGLAVLEITSDIAVQATSFPDEFPADPADRLIAATARAFGLTLVTKDQRLLDSDLVETVW